MDQGLGKATLQTGKLLFLNNKTRKSSHAYVGDTCWPADGEIAEFNRPVELHRCQFDKIPVACSFEFFDGRQATPGWLLRITASIFFLAKAIRWQTT
jgi:hypothetical protein